LGGLLQIFVGGKLLETGAAMGGAFLSSGFVIQTTLAIMHRLSPEEYIVATIDLYLDLLRLFVKILKVLDKIDRKGAPAGGGREERAPKTFSQFWLHKLPCAGGGSPLH
jgi:hypothetical protein